MAASSPSGSLAAGASGSPTTDTSARPLDNDTGPNNEQNHPILSSLVRNGESGTIEGRLDGERTANYVVDVYLNRTADAAAGGRACDPSDLGEGEVFLRSFTLRTDTIGAAPFTIDVSGIAPGETVTATATKTGGGNDPLQPAGPTSEFSPASTWSDALRPAPREAPPRARVRDGSQSKPPQRHAG